MDGADAHSFANAIREAVVEVENNVPARIAAHLDDLLSLEQSA